MKKIMSMLLVAAMMIALVGCGGNGGDDTPDNTKATEKKADDKSGSDASTEKEKVTIWCWDPNFNVAIMEKAAEMYGDSVEFEVVDMAKGDVEQKLLTNLGSGITKDLPDIVLIEDYNAQKYLRSFPGSFEDLTGKINHADFAGYKVELMTVDGKVYGVPFDSGVSGFFYRSDILAEAGYEAADLENITWDEYIEIGKVVLEKTGKQLGGYDPNDGGLLRIMLNGSGSWYTDAEGNVTVAGNEALIEGMNVYAEMFNSGITKTTAGWGEWVGAINTSETASIITGVWIGGSVKAGEGQEGKWAVAPTPRLNVAGAKNASNLGGSSWYVLSSSESKATAVDFLSKMYGGDDTFYQEILVERGAMGSYVPATSGASYAAEDVFFGGQKVYEDMGKWMQDIPSINYGLYTYEADAAIMKYMPKVLDGSMTAEKALEEAQKQIESQIQ